MRPLGFALMHLDRQTHG